MLLKRCFSQVPVTGILFFAGIFFATISFAQDDDRWRQLRQTPGTNFYTIQQAFDSAWAEREQEMLQQRRAQQNTSAQRSGSQEELDGPWFQFRRWEWFMEPRVAPSGDVTLPGTTYQRFQEYLQSNPAAMAQQQASIARQASSGTWTFVGPTGAPTGSGAGRLCCVRFDPTNSNVIYVGTPAGGLWKSTNAGGSWTCLSDFLASIGAADVAIDHTNPNILYLATGDNDATDSPSIGVLKSTDGGQTWNTTGLTFNASQGRRIGRLLIDPVNPLVLYAATSAGIFKTVDGAATWFLVYSFNTMELEFKPNDPNTLYAGRASLYRSTNAGLSWTQIATGLPSTSAVNRLAIAVTPDAPDNIYVVTVEPNSWAFEGLYVSVNGGASFTQMSNSPNLLGWAVNGSDGDGQGWYDLAIAVAPYDANVVIVGGVNVWRSNNMGISWNIEAHWYGGGGNPYVHADVHDIQYGTGTGNYYVACDGGLFKTSDDGASFSDLSSNLSIAQLYRAGVSGSTAGTVISGHQDNGTNVKVGSNYFSGMGGDGMDCFIDRTNDNIMFGELYYGDFERSNDGGNSFNSITNGTPGNGDWVTPWEQDPVLPNVLYAGFDQLYKTTNQGNSWAPVGTQGFGNLKDIEIAPSNTQRIYVSTDFQLFRSDDGGVTWTNVSAGLNNSGAAITRIAASPYDHNKVWATLSGYQANEKVYYSANGGTTWTNISYGLPNLPANCVVAVPGTSSDAIFVGCDVGVYYHDNSSATWMPFFTGLAHAPISDLDIFLPTMTLTAATYGRGVWECPIDQSLLAPLADFSASQQTVCAGQAVTFTDLSTFAPTAWSWSFPGGTPATSSQQNPSVTYNTPGIYPVTLVATNAAGSGTTTRTTYITVHSAQLPPYTEGFVSTTFLPSGWSALNAANQSHYWQRSATVGHNSSESAFFNNYNNNTNGARDEMRSMGLNFSGYTSLSLSFDVAYARYNSTRSDTLEVLVSADCGATWTQVYIKGGNTLGTVSSQTSAFTPTNSQWRTETVNINSYAGQSNVIVAFSNHGRNGNYLWIDNINITGTVNAAPVSAFSAGGNVCENNTRTFSDLSAPAATSWSWTFPGGTPATSTSQNPSVTWTAPGTYTVSLVSTNSFGSDSSSQVITVLPAPPADAGIDTVFCSGTYVQLGASGGITYSWSPATGISNTTIASPGVYLTSSRTFSVTVTDINGCSAMDTVRVDIRPNPTFNVTSTPNSICYGDTALVIATNPNWSYTWTPAATLSTATGDSAQAWPTVSTTYTVVATDTNGCSGTMTRAVNVYPFMATPVVLVNGWTLTCSTPGFTYRWYLNGVLIPGATSQSYVATQVGNYSVEAVSGAGCESGISAQEFVNGVELPDLLPFTIAPNPNNGVFDLSFDAATGADFTITIYSVDGKLVYIEELPRFSGLYNKRIDLSGFGNGAYFIRLTNDRQESTQRIIVF